MSAVRGAWVANASGFMKRMQAPSGVYTAGGMKALLTLHVCVGANGDGSPIWKLLEYWQAPPMAITAWADNAAANEAFADWNQVTDPEDVRYDFGVEVQWYNTANDNPIDGPEGYAQNAGASTPRTFASGVTDVYAKVRWTNNFGAGPEVTTNSVFVGNA
jgi:hypothetical protein